MAVRTRRRSILRQAVASNAPPTPANAAAVWWADDIAQADGTQVATWTDRINNISVTQATAGARPLYDTDGLNGKPSVNFDGVDDFLTVNNTVSNSNIGSIVAVSFLSKKNNSALWATGRGYAEAWPENYMMGVSVTEGMRMQHNNSNTSPASADVVRTTDSSTDIMIYEWSTNGLSWNMRKDNFPQALTATARTNSGEWFQQIPSRTTFSLGACPYGQVPAPYHNNFFGGSIAYIGVFDAPLSTQDRYNLYKWIESYYGIPGIPGLSDYEQAVLADSPTAFWPMQEITGSLSDLTGNGYIASKVGSGGVTYRADGPITGIKSIEFDGSSGVGYDVTDNDIWSSTNFTFEGWIYLGSSFFAGQYARYFVEKYASSTLNEWFGQVEDYDGGRLTTQVSNTSQMNWSNKILGSWGPPEQQWHYVAFSFSGSSMTLYLNGVSVGLAAASSGARRSNSSGALMIGHGSSVVTRSWKGRLSMMAFYPYALTQGQVQSHYEAMTT